MAGLSHLFDTYNKQGKEFVDNLFNKDLVVTEKPDGSVFSVQASEDGIDFFKRDDRQPISNLDRTIMSLYEPPIEYIENITKGKKLPKNLRFGFEYFQNTKPVSIAYDKLPKNNLVLTHMKEYDSSGKIIKFIDNPKELNKWADFFGVEKPFVIFNGKLSETQKNQLIEFLETPFGDLVEKFKTNSFTKYIVSILNKKLKSTALNNDLNKPIEGLVFKFNDGEFISKVVDPIFTQIARDKAIDRNKNNKSSDEFGLMLYTFINWLIETDALNSIIPVGETTDDKYIDLMTRLIKNFIEENKVFLVGLNIKKPDFAKAPEFALNTKTIKNKNVVSFIKKNKDFEEIFKMLLSGFRKTRKRKTNMIDANLMKQINSVVNSIKEKTNMLSESFMTFSEWQKTKL